MTRSLALLLADARFPSGGHAHSGGMEQACDEGVVTDLPTLAGFLQGRLSTAGVVAAHAAAAVCARPASWDRVDRALDARITSPAMRRVSRQQGAQLVRSARGVWDGFAPPIADPHHPVALGLVASVAGLEPVEGASIAAYGAVSSPASAALRLLGLDPSAVARLLVSFAPDCDELAQRAAALGRIPAFSAPIGDWLAEAHAERKERLFAS